MLVYEKHKSMHDNAFEIIKIIMLGNYLIKNMLFLSCEILIRKLE